MAKAIRKSVWLPLFLMALLVGCSDSPLYSKLTEDQANEIEAELLSIGIDARKMPTKEEDVWSITVPREHIPAAVKALKSLGLPRRPKQTMGEVFAKEGFVSSPMEERARYLYALSQEFQTTLMEIDGVASARVHIALPETTPLQENKPSASASVIIIQEPGVDLSLYETDIKAIFTDGVEGLDDVNKVTVKFFSRRPVTDSIENPLSIASDQAIVERGLR